MTESQRPYQKLPGRAGLTVLGSSSLWLGADHLLAVRNLHFLEEYRRFEYGDIQALLLRRTGRRGLWAAALGALAALFGWLTWSAASSPLVWIPALATAFFLLLSLANWLRGPTCACHLRTAVHAEPLPSLRRVRPARKAFALLRRRVERVQGRADRGAVRSDPRPWGAGGNEDSTSPAPGA